MGLLKVVLSRWNGVVIVLVMRLLIVCYIRLLMLNCGLFSELDIGRFMLMLFLVFFSSVIVSFIGRCFVLGLVLCLLKVSWVMKMWLFVFSLCWLSW